MQNPQTIVQPPTLKQIHEMSQGLFISKTLFAGIELGVFEMLASGPMACETLATRLNLPASSLQRLLTALAALGLLERINEDWSNTPPTQTYLVASSPQYIGNLLSHRNNAIYPLWLYLPAAVRENSPRLQDAFGPTASGNFFETTYTDANKLKAALEATSKLVLDYITELLRDYDFSPFHHVMDIGGSLGALPIALLNHYPRLSATIFELPQVKPLSEESVARHAMSDRIQVVGGDFFKDALPTGADLITLSYILHDWNDAECLIILKKCFEALVPGGSILVLEKPLNANRTGPLLPALMDLSLLVGTSGRERTRAEYFSLLTTAGFLDPGSQILTDARDAIYARKP